MPDPMMDPVEFARMVEPVDDLQPYQRNLLRFVGLDVAKDPTDESVLIVYDRAQVNRALTPRLTFISTPSEPDTRALWMKMRMEMWRQPLYTYIRPVEFLPMWFDEVRVPARPSQTDLARWEDDGGAVW